MKIHRFEEKDAKKVSELIVETLRKTNIKDYSADLIENYVNNFHPENSHVVPALLRRFHEAKMQDLPSVTVWGSGSPMREFLYVDDMASACLHVMNLPKEVYGEHVLPMSSHINVGTGKDCTIRELANTIARAVGYRGDILWDTSKPDGTPRKLLDVSLLKRLGWQYSVELDEGIERTYQWFLQNQEKFRA